MIAAAAAGGAITSTCCSIASGTEAAVPAGGRAGGVLATATPERWAKRVK